jgi:hypothetical protein
LDLEQRKIYWKKVAGVPDIKIDVGDINQRPSSSLGEEN